MFDSYEPVPAAESFTTTTGKFSDCGRPVNQNSQQIVMNLDSESLVDAFPLNDEVEPISSPSPSLCSEYVTSFSDIYSTTSSMPATADYDNLQRPMIERHSLK